MGYRIGTVNVTSGSNKVVGVGTEWADLKNGVMPGFPFKGPNGLVYEIKSIESNTGMTLYDAYTGQTASGQPYSILTTYQGDLSQFAAQFNALLPYYRLTRSQMMSVLTESGEVQVIGDDGSIITVLSLQKMNAALNGKVTGVKQTSQDDTTAGSVILNGGHGLGANARPRAAGATGGAAGCGFFSYTANHADNPFGGTGASGLHVQEAGTYGWDLLGRDGGGPDFRLRQISAGVASPWSTLWTSANLNPVKNDQTIVSITTAALVHAWATNTANTSCSFRNDGVNVDASTIRFGSGAFTKVSGTYSILTAGPSASTSGVRIQAGDSTGYMTYNLWTDKNLPNPATLDTTQTFEGTKTFRTMFVRAASGNTGIEIGRVDAASSTFMDFHTSGNDIDFDARIVVAGGSASLGAATMNFVAGNLQWNGNALINGTTNQTIGGQKVFTEQVRVTRTSAVLALETTNISEGVIGRSILIGNIDGQLRFYSDPSASSPTGRTTVTVPKGTGNVLVSGVNAVADSSGFWKTASPVVKLFADGTSELTSEAEGITTERLSEGVYRISGCLGLNADRAWGGDDGGIDVPMCRNKLPRLWVDYGGDDGGEQINPDGSIVIRTYHRPHPDAPAFARNEIDGYASGDPIDIPGDTFISVRVQMPERAEPK